MKKKIVLLLLTALLCVPLAARAELKDALFDRAKQAVNLLSYGEYQKAIDKLAFSDNEPTADDFERFVEDNLDGVFSAVQSRVAVGYKKGSSWRLAVPVEEPSYGGVQALVLRSKDGKTFDAYTASSWRDVMADVDESASVVWNEAYEADDPVFLTDDWA